MTNPHPVPCRVVGTVESPFRERFGIPRQASLVPEAIGRVVFAPDVREALVGLDGFSHVWLVTALHALPDGASRCKVRPPRLGGDTRIGAFATRAPHRPNPIGLSLVEVVAVEPDAPALVFRGCDLLDGTPVIDVKPYVDYADRPRGAVRHGWLGDAQPPDPLAVRFAPDADARAAERDATTPGFRALVARVVALDPRPAHQHAESADYAARLLDVDVHWRVDPTGCTITAILDAIEG